jgi:hypothetical protein
MERTLSVPRIPLFLVISVASVYTDVLAQITTTSASSEWLCGKTA